MSDVTNLAREVLPFLHSEKLKLLAHAVLDLSAEVERLRNIADANKSLAVEIERLGAACIATEYEVQQTLGPVLYGAEGGAGAWGEDTAATLAIQAAREIERLRAERTER